MYVIKAIVSQLSISYRQRVNSVDESVVLSRFVIHRCGCDRSLSRSYDKNVMGTADELCRVPFLGFRYKIVRVKFLCLSVLHNLIGPVVYEISEDGATEPICFVG